MRVISSRYNLVFVVEDTAAHHQLDLHAQQMIPYPVASLYERESDYLKEQSVHYDASYHLVNTICIVRKRRGGYEKLVSRLGFEEEG